jgi:hypothetical protein
MLQQLCKDFDKVAEQSKIEVKKSIIRQKIRECQRLTILHSKFKIQILGILTKLEKPTQKDTDLIMNMADKVSRNINLCFEEEEKLEKQLKSL